MTFDLLIFSAVIISIKRRFLNQCFWGEHLTVDHYHLTFDLWPLMTSMVQRSPAFTILYPVLGKSSICRASLSWFFLNHFSVLFLSLLPLYLFNQSLSNFKHLFTFTPLNYLTNLLEDYVFVQNLKNNYIKKHQHFMPRRKRSRTMTDW